MKYLLIFILLVAHSCKTHCQFLDIALNDVSTNGIFISLPIKSSTFAGKAIIENVDLFRLVNKQTNCSFLEYSNIIKDIIIKSDTLLVSNEKLDEIGFQIITLNSNSMDYGTLSTESLIDKYFHENLILESVKDNETNFIIDKLFSFGILTRIDDDSGRLRLINYQQK
ncbi:MAG: hypothetical protein JNJ57_04570 [Saprospiraceae bacterium]|nr:hypothetical protein [Saprospiraceae bacterium]